MKLDEAIPIIEDVVGVPFRDFLPAPLLRDLHTNKGHAGQVLERYVGLKQGNARLDFEDGELKTNKSDFDGSPLETMAIIQLNGIIDEVLDDLVEFEQTQLYRKIANGLYVPICKVGDETEWMLLPPIQIDLRWPENREIRDQLEEDYHCISKQLHEHVQTSADGYIHTSNGRLIQVRSKDSKPYKPIRSRSYDHPISNKAHSFYFLREFMRLIQERDTRYPFAP